MGSKTSTFLVCLLCSSSDMLVKEVQFTNKDPKYMERWVACVEESNCVQWCHLAGEICWCRLISHSQNMTLCDYDDVVV